MCVTCAFTEGAMCFFRRLRLPETVIISLSGCHSHECQLLCRCWPHESYRSKVEVSLMMYNIPKLLQLPQGVVLIGTPGFCLLFVAGPAARARLMSFDKEVQVYMREAGSWATAK